MVFPISHIHVRYMGKVKCYQGQNPSINGWISEELFGTLATEAFPNK